MVAPLAGLLAPIAGAAARVAGQALTRRGAMARATAEMLTEEEKQLEKTKEPTFESVEDIRQDVEFLTNPNLPDQQTIYNKISKDELNVFAEQRKEGAKFGFKRFDKYATLDKTAQEVENLNRQNAQDYYDNKISFNYSNYISLI